MALKILNFLLVLLCGFFRVKSAEVPAFMRFGIYFPGIDAVLARF